MNTNEKSKTILFGALDWGLGHATRAMPLIDSLLRLGHKVILASSGDAALLWQKHYPDLQQLPLVENQVVYGKNASWSTLWQSPRLLKNIRLENQIVGDFAAKIKIDLIVSDNRYGLYHPNIPAILITHQLRLMPPQKLFFLHKIWEKSWIQFRKPLFAPFREIWVPDFASTTDNLTAGLAHLPETLPLRFIGPLSRLTPTAPLPEATGLLLLLSGPEPQRTRLEQLLLKQLGGTEKRITLVRGLIDKHIPLPAQSNVLPHFRSFDYLSTNQLSHEIAAHELVISRSGYSTIMDLQQMGAKAVFVPTPGQTEQEYLAKRLSELQIAAFQAQGELQLISLIARNQQFTGFLPHPAHDYNQLWRETLSSLEA